MTETQIRAAAINIRALPTQRCLIDLAAAALHKSRSDFMPFQARRNRFISASALSHLR